MSQQYTKMRKPLIFVILISVTDGRGGIGRPGPDGRPRGVGTIVKDGSARNRAKIPTIPCLNKLCHYKKSGNYEIQGYPNHFVQCLAGIAFCQPCFPQTLVYSKKCNQCLYNKKDNCFEPKLEGESGADGASGARGPNSSECPLSICERKGPGYSGNAPDPDNDSQFVICQKGQTVACFPCNFGTIYDETWDSCEVKGSKGLPGIPAPTKFTSSSGPKEPPTGPAITLPTITKRKSIRTTTKNAKKYFYS